MRLLAILTVILLVIWAPVMASSDAFDSSLRAIEDYEQVRMHLRGKVDEFKSLSVIWLDSRAVLAAIPEDSALKFDAELMHEELVDALNRVGQEILDAEGDRDKKFAIMREIVLSNAPLLPSAQFNLILAKVNELSGYEPGSLVQNQ